MYQLLVAVMIPEKSHLKKEGLFQLMVWGTVYHGGRSFRGLVPLSRQERSREKQMLVLTPFLLIWSMTSLPVMAPPTVKVGLPFRVIHPVRLTMETNYHTTAGLFLSLHML